MDSPSFTDRADGAQPYELKFLLDLGMAERAESWARTLMLPDPHGHLSLNGAYSTTTLYLDTPALDVLHRTPSYRRRKYRIRRYGDAGWASLERKTRSGDQVRKRRSPLPVVDLDLLAAADSLPDWIGHWFHRRILARGLLPSAMVSYTRTAYFAPGAAGEGPMRLTIDRDLHGQLASSWRPGPFEGGRGLLTGRAIVELKFLDAMPQPFKSLVAMLNLAPASISKYRVCREAWALPVAIPPPAEVSRA